MLKILQTYKQAYRQANKQTNKYDSKQHKLDRPVEDSISCNTSGLEGFVCSQETRQQGILVPPHLSTKLRHKKYL
jgi:hypothetical protein